MGFMIGTGGTALVSLVLGTGDREKANRYFSMTIHLTVPILPLFFGVDGIWWAITVAEVFAFMFSAAFLFAKRGKYHYL